MSNSIDTRSTSELGEKKRFEYELDFLQSLANPHYIQYLAYHKYLRKPDMIHFLKYLQYWKQPNYIKFIQYPACLYYLEQLQNPDFRQACENPEIMKNIIDQHEAHFTYYKVNRTPVVPKVDELNTTSKPMDTTPN
ncbi:hypothetical protein ENUP19_0082G0157 [Entamoeba nuttalli]|uniref:Mediator of RNA polymerase II transcription subunit 31 n=2 Tax=Entamoeba nuttalli TaxID=412467 RepID=K2H4K6_ENTNP|nr:SOH1 protein, putative [Entamoeba nuttalli P19]EKE41242.1 SOH1 protein, putative [Entamoeba nuttalli P19]|eukprot:XP_008856424.1 SOH1 protein, putative [Entamoeba nuttalli P19]